VREALAMLEAEELVRNVPNKGTIVRRVTVDEVTQTYEVRRVLEGYAARVAAERITSAELGALERIERDMEKALKRKGISEDERVVLLTSLNADFHLAVAAAGGNTVLTRSIKALIETPIYARAYYWYADSRRRESVSDHSRMIELLRSHDGAACERFWQEHHVRGRDYLVEYLSQHGEAE